MRPAQISLFLTSLTLTADAVHSMIELLKVTSERPDVPDDVKRLLFTAAVEVQQLRNKVLYYRDTIYKDSNIEVNS